MANHKKILIVGMGGTLAMSADASGVLRPASNLEKILTAVPVLKDMACVETFEMENRDSTNVNPTHWTKLAHKIVEVCSHYDGIIVIHGTDTMAYTAGAISLACGRNWPIPIVFTGSQLPLCVPGSDARFNLENAMKTVIEAANKGINEVMIVFSDVILRAARAIKVSESKFHAFDSPAFPSLGTITAMGTSFSSIASKFKKKTFQPKSLDLRPHFQRSILSLEVVPGLEPSILLEFLRSGKCQGLLLKSLGAGNVPSEDEYSLLTVIEAAIKTYKVPVLVSTKFVGGHTRMDVYEPGKRALEVGAISTGDMTDVMAQVKFMWALAQGHREPDALRKIMKTSRVGEITEESEL